MVVNHQTTPDGEIVQHNLMCFRTTCRFHQRSWANTLTDVNKFRNSQFFEAMHQHFPKNEGDDLSTKHRLEFYLQTLADKFVMRPLFTPTLFGSRMNPRKKRKERDETQVLLKPEPKRSKGISGMTQCKIRKTKLPTIIRSLYSSA